MEFSFSTCKRELIKLLGRYSRRWMVNAPHWTEEAWKFPFSTCKKKLMKVFGNGGVCKKELIKVAGTYEGGW